MIDGVIQDAPEAQTADDIRLESLLVDEKALAKEIRRLEKQMQDHARNLEFEQAAAARDQLTRLKEMVLLR